MEKNPHNSNPKKDLLIYFSIIALTALIVTIHFLHLGTMGIVLILFIAIFEAVILAFNFMHLINKGAIIYALLLLTVLFFLGLIFWPGWDISNSPRTSSEYTVN